MVNESQPLNVVVGRGVRDHRAPPPPHFSDEETESENLSAITWLAGKSGSRAGSPTSSPAREYTSMLSLGGSQEGRALDSCSPPVPRTSSASA